MIYLDSNATTFPVPDLNRVMEPYLSEEFGNPSSGSYLLGKRAKQALEDARIELSRLVDSEPEEIIFTSGGTEAISIAILGASAKMKRESVLLESAIEHVAVREAFRFCSKGFSHKVSIIPALPSGVVDINFARNQLNPDNDSVSSLMWANNETGVIQPVNEFSELHKSTKGLFITDAVQAVGKTSVSFRKSGANFMSLSAHKFGGPKGIGALIVKKGTSWESPFCGGGQEGGRRGGTEAVALIAGMGEAARYAKENLEMGEEERLGSLRDLFENLLLDEFSDISIIGKNSKRLSNTSFFLVPGIIGQDLVVELGKNGVFVSAGSACKTGQFSPSHVLTAMGISAMDSLSAIRVSFGHKNQLEEVKNAVSVFSKTIKNEREKFSKKINKVLT
ncbi:MAG TPA: cysteine desulfurase family protein [Oligoflexia bacterium]|nr:cysteine desulfurase family protein [Oligoflexia bacterium]HMP48133.1 cysteine desulfurase family protein [Oligoflexia bacterium]